MPAHTWILLFNNNMVLLMERAEVVKGEWLSPEVEIQKMVHMVMLVTKDMDVELV